MRWRTPSLRVAMLIVALVAFGAAAVGVGVKATPVERTTADEPHYLVTAISIWTDGDLDVYDEFLHRDYAPFNGLMLRPQAEPTRDGRLIEPHDPLLPVLLAVPTGLGGWIAAKLTLCLFAAAVAALTLWTAVRRFAVPVGPALAVVALLAATVPLAAYGSQVYPEIVGALAVVGAVAALTGSMRRGGLAVLALCLVALPWLSIKYVPVTAALAAVALWRLLRGRRLVPAAALAGALAACAAAFVAVHVTVYGGVTAYAAGSHFVNGQLTVVGNDPDYFGRSRRLVGLLVDRDFGIGAWQPLWLLLVPAVAALLARRPRGTGALLLPLGAGWFVATFLALTMQGWWFPGRQLVVVLPLAAIAIAWSARAGGARLIAAVALGAVGGAAQAFIVTEGLLGRIAWVIDLQTTVDPFYRAIRWVTPDYLVEDAATWPLHWGWTVLLAAAAVWAWRSERAGAQSEKTIPAGSPGSAAMRGSAARSAV
ncbi:MAG TPA: hypothetical protein VL422_02235 [Miltoncostaea sp.]|nr:hypothetical protein [Miltoncostaea sp.]